MARLPIPGSDGDTWGDVLNEFLRVAHREDGALRGVVEATNVKDFGATGDGVTDDSAAIHSALATAAHALFFPAGTYRVGAAITFNVAVQFAPGAMLKPDAGAQITINRAILAPQDAMIFDVGAAGSEPLCDNPCDPGCNKQMATSPFAIRWTGKLYANWWSGSNMGAQWNNMRASLPSRFQEVSEAATLAIVGLHVVTTTMNWNDLRGDYHPVKIDMGEAHLIGKTNGKPVIEMINSRHVIVEGLTLYGAIEEATPNVGILLSRNSEGNASGEHLFSNFRLRGGYTVAAVYIVDSEISKWVNGMVSNDAANGQYGLFIGSSNRNGICPRWADQLNDTLTMKGQWFTHVHWRGNPSQGGLYLYGADNVFVHGAFFKHGHLQQIPGPHLVLDTTSKTINDCTFTDIFCEGAGNTQPTIGCHLTGASAVRNCVFEFKDFAATGSGFQIDVPTQFCKFRQWTANNFVVTPAIDMLYCEIETSPANPPFVTLGRKFTGFIQMGYPEARLALPSSMELFYATVCDLERGLVRHHRNSGHSDWTFMVSDSDAASVALARARGTPGNELPLQAGDVIGEYRFLARYSRNGGQTSDVCKIQAVYRGDGSNRVGELRLITENGNMEHTVARAHPAGYLIFQARDVALADTELNPYEMTFYYDRASNQLQVKVHADGIVRIGSILLSP